MIITLTSSSGAGKTTYCGEILSRQPEWKLVPSYTGRAHRQKDLPGEYIYNVSQEEFRQITERGETLWTINEHGNTYATLRRDVLKAAQSANHSVMLLAPKTIEILREFMETKNLLHFYLLSPPEDELRKRLSRRNSSEEEISRRISDCQNWDTEALNSKIPYSFIRGDIQIKNAVDSILKTHEILFPKGEEK